VAQLLHDLQSSDELQHQPVAGAGLDPRLALLRQWQSDRLADTYADLLANEQFGPAGRFFLSDIYAARDFSQRDHDVERLHAWLSRKVPAVMLKLLTGVVELNALSNALDERLARVLTDELGLTDRLSAELYAAGYRRCDNYAERARQIELIADVLTQVGEGARHRMVGAAIKVVRGPAQRAGWHELLGFLERGYAAFRPMRDVKSFVATVQMRETRFLNEIYAGANGLHESPGAAAAWQGAAAAAPAAGEEAL
jgi:hypothetical protein